MTSNVHDRRQARIVTFVLTFLMAFGVLAGVASAAPSADTDARTPAAVDGKQGEKAALLARAADVGVQDAVDADAGAALGT